jgi:lipopolysaccharide biosynthesis glycosyltransferase
MPDRRSVANVYIGWDRREIEAFRVARESLHRHASIPCNVVPIVLAELELSGLMRRPRTKRGGQMYDLISDAPMSTEFAIARFLTPLLAQRGWALFADADVVFLEDVAKLFELADPDFAVMCVHHPQLNGGAAVKMDGQIQTTYARKNWSSVMLFNCDHPANRGLTLDMINRVPGRDLHAFCWLDDRWIGELPPEWNWLVGVQARPSAPKLAHFTLGGPWLAGWKPHDHDDIWLDAAQDPRS